MLSFHTNHRLLLVVPVTVFAFLSVAIAVVPAEKEPSGGAATASPEVRRGREIYQREGCAYCHTQQVRSDNRQPRGTDGLFPALDQDARYGRPSQAKDYASDDPPFLGTQRTGPDLRNVGARLPSTEWNLTHLFDPRLVAPHSVMPSYRWYFHTASEIAAGDRSVLLPVSAAERYGRDFKIWATPDALALVAYLMSLKTEPTETPAR